VASEPLKVDAPMTLRDQIEARARHAEFANRTFLMHDEVRWTYAQFRNESVRMAQFLLQQLGSPEGEAGNVAIMLENHPELAALLGGCAYAKGVLFGINTGLRGEVLAGVLNHSKARLLVVNEQFYPDVLRVLDRLEHIAPERIFVLSTRPGVVEASRDLRARLAELGPADASREIPSFSIAPSDNLMVIYTSGTTGLPKGIINNNFKLLVTGMAVSANVGLGREDCCYISMPLFHSNSMFVGFMPAFHVGGRVGLRERFSATRFLDDLRSYGATYWNYVGEPVHYVLSAIEKQHGGDAARIEAEVTRDPRVMLRFAVGNGAAPPDIDRLTRYFDLEEMYELYGSTEAAISTFRKTGDPRGSVGEVRDAAVKILNERGEECEIARHDEDGRILNYEQAVGEICRVAPDTALFQGYYENPKANSEKYRDGVYHSGDLGHIVVRDGQRFLFFDGRTADWIRKDGENFSANQVGRLISEHPDIALAVAYGVPCIVSDELVMAAIKLRDGAEFKPKEFFLWCEAQVSGGSMDRKWVPDFVRVVQDFEYTETQKVLVRHLKAAHFNRELLPAEPIYWRRRGDLEFRPFSKEDYEDLRKQFAAAERLHLLEH
jgi:fatty-acyl-CoA synthase